MVGRGLFSVFFLVPLILILEIPVLLSGAAVGAYLVFARNLPEIPQLASYQPRTVSTFFADDGTVIGTFYKQKRFVVDLQQMPPHVINAFLAAEDARFYVHGGVDWRGLTRAMLHNLQAGRIVQGGSTITMQVTRNFLLSRERRMSRKIKEIILASRLERMWGKKKTLYIYLNEIYLGEGCYGVEAAARGYFDKPVEHLTVEEAALIAGLVASPARYNPFKSEELARQRQLTVLGRMLRSGFITQDQYDKAKAQSLHIRREVTRPFDLAPDFTEAVRRSIVKKYGEEMLYNEGLKVFTTCRLDFQRKAVEAMEKGLAELKARQKNLAIVRTLPVDQIQSLLQTRKTPTLTEGNLYQGAVLKVVRKKDAIELRVALSPTLKGLVQLNHAAGSIYKEGQVLAIRFDKFVGETPLFIPDDKPQIQGALIAIEHKTGYVRALVGGASSEHFQFNRAIQAKRQPGSAFKPMIYATAIEKKSYSPGTIIVDEPIVVDFEREDEEWAPRNASGNFLGPLSLRRALELSRNICTIKILMDVDFDAVIQMARKMGIRSHLGRNLSLSLGTSELSLFELTSAYTVFPNSGVHVEPVVVKRIEDRFGNVLEDNTELPLLEASQIPHPVPREEFKGQVMASGLEPVHSYAEEEPEIEEEEGQEQSGENSPAAGQDEKAGPGRAKDAAPSRVRAAMSPQTAYIMTSLLQGGVRYGTGARMSQYVKRKDVAGKTGTTNNAEDAWFIGFSQDFTTGVWVGFDEKRPLGEKEEGARAALPVWGYFMQAILKNRPEREFPVPPQITFKEMVTFTGGAQVGYTPRMVSEPVYTPFVGRTLILSPLDTPETLRSYPGVEPPQPQYWQPYNPATYQTPPPPPSYPQQPAQVVPLRPMDGRNLFPEAPRQAPRVAPPPRTAAPPVQAGQTGKSPESLQAPAAPETYQRDARPVPAQRKP